MYYVTFVLSRVISSPPHTHTQKKNHKKKRLASFMHPHVIPNPWEFRLCLKPNEDIFNESWQISVFPLKLLCKHVLRVHKNQCLFLQASTAKLPFAVFDTALCMCLYQCLYVYQNIHWELEALQFLNGLWMEEKESLKFHYKYLNFFWRQTKVLLVWKCAALESFNTFWAGLVPS